MKQQEFDRLFPHADSYRFKPDYDGSIVFVSDDDTYIDVESMAFFDNYVNVKYLNLPNTGLGWWKDDHYNFLETWRRAYKYRNLKDDDLFPLRYNNNTQNTQSQTWGPKEWNSIKKYDVPTIPKTFHILGKLFSGTQTQNVNFENFWVYVNDKDFFMLNKKLPWNFINTRKVDFDDMKNEYCLSLVSMYVLSYLGGMSLKNLNSDNPLARPLAYFYFFYHLNKFYNYRDFSQYDISDLKKHNWPLYTTGRFTLSKGSFTRKDRELFHLKGKMHIDSEGIWFEKDKKKRNLIKDYLKLLLVDSHGLSNIGQILLQESCQAYVYCVLGAQAKTRWKIVGDSANSLQTQHVFMDLVSEVTKQDNVSTLIKSMRTAIAHTRVRLDFVISPGLELLPSNMIFIKDTPGYNNILIVSTRKQKFGVNNVNSSLKLVDDTSQNNLQNNLQHTSNEFTRNTTSGLPANLQTKIKQNLSKSQTKNKQTDNNLQGYFNNNLQNNLQHTSNESTSNLLGDRYVTYNDNSQNTLSNTGLFVIAAIVAIPILYLLK